MNANLDGLATTLDVTVDDIVKTDPSFAPYRGQTIRSRVPQPGQLPAPHPPRRWHQPGARDSTSHENPTTPSQVGRVGPSFVNIGGILS